MPCTGVVTALAKLGHFAFKKIAVVAPMCLMAGAAVLGHWGMLKGKRPFLFRVTRVAEVRDGISIEHVLAETSMSRMATGAFDLSLGYGVVGLPA